MPESKQNSGKSKENALFSRGTILWRKMRKEEQRNQKRIPFSNSAFCGMVKAKKSL